MAQIVVVDPEVAELLSRIKDGSDGVLRLRCNGECVATLVKVGLVRVQTGVPGRLDRVFALPAAWEVEVRTE